MDNHKKSGVELHIGLTVDDVAPGKLWASKANELGEKLIEYQGFNVEVVNSIKYNSHENCAEFKFFARYDTAYIMCHNGIPITIYQFLEE